MKAYILTIGDEILIGQIVNSNAAYLAEALSGEGIQVVEHLSVSDTREGIMGGVMRAFEAADLVLCTGGLGPTKDDITKQVLADYFETELDFHSPTWERLQTFIRNFGREPTADHRAQCRMPAAADILTNKRGTAPGMWFEEGNKILVSMPGVPYEMRYLMQAEVLPRLREAHADAEQERSITLLTAGAGETTIADQIADIEDGLPEHMSLAYLPNLGTVRLRITTRGEDEDIMREELEEVQHRIEQTLGKLIYGYGKSDLSLAVGNRLKTRGATVVTAESCTGGTIAQMLVAHPGSSAYFLGGAVTYGNDLKKKLLGVRLGTMKKHGAVSEQTVTEMAEGARKKLGGDYAIAVSGVAGPGGGTEEKPVGTIWLAVAGPAGTRTKLLRAGKDRKRNITYAAHAGLNLLRLVLDDE